ncbi:TetR/AcrR family transcriptional regulator [Deinococcus hopiensis]|uniref:Transcriptional regulator, TetR family n=1 Tax=Deinococcus hopiensis KR-140 TaxID=695939 RepID=A0A1W1VUS5_9DEIO|nr:TetR/AcrR family transcriptional regulator [Deinococcus hopiensis]SMB97125.1 transcriptional regulator, TetR family [Deinococcus hopiensis KR-140]
MKGSTTVQDILDSAQALVQRQGYNAFAYKDIAQDVGIRGASIHYHFPTKADLGVALVRRYRNVVDVQLEHLNSLPAPEALRRFGRLYQSVTTEDGRVCLNLMLAADLPTLPEPVANELRRSLEAQEAWLEAVMEEGARSNTLTLRTSPREEARSLLALTEGAMLLARVAGDPLRFSAVYDHVLSALIV